MIVSVYNGAGERVKQLLSVQMTGPPPGAQLSSNTLSALSGDGSNVSVTYSGGSLGSWDGTDSAGDPVLNGVYYVQVSTIGPDGEETSVVQQVTVSRSIARVSALIYNSVGEVVRHLYGSAGDPAGAQMTNVVLSSSVVAPGAGNNGGSLGILVKASGGNNLALTWDGTGDNGQTMTPGVYELEVHWDDGMNGVSDIDKSIVVRPGQTQAGVLAEPNLLGPGTGSIVTFQAMGDQGLALRFKIYTVAGERVPAAAGPSGPDRIQYDASGLASGLYLAVVDGTDASNHLQLHQVVKFTVLR